MITEVELKLAVSQGFAEFLSKEMSNFQVLSQEKTLLKNCYYDTEDRFFAQNKMGLRVRQNEEGFVLTLKTDGEVHGGLHIRPEYNIKLADGTPDLEKLNEIYPIENWQSLKLEPIFTTDFQRQSWVIESGFGVEIEVSFDEGQIVAKDKTETIREVEFELVNGDIEDLLFFVSQLSLESGVRLSSLSKAQRGYRLAQEVNDKSKDWSVAWREFLTSDAESSDKLTALFRLEQDLIEETVYLGENYFAQDFVRTVERIGAFFNLYQYYSENSSLLQIVLDEQIELGKTTVDEDLLDALLDNNNRLLHEVKDIIRVHSENRNNAQAFHKLIELLEQGLYVKRIIYLLLLLENVCGESIEDCLCL